jgi:hypothetical protein
MFDAVSLQTVVTAAAFVVAFGLGYISGSLS